MTFEVEISSVISEILISGVSSIPKYFLSGSLGADTTALCSMFAVKHLLLSKHLSLFLQLHPLLLEVS